MPFPFEFILETLPPFATVYDLQEICRDETYSFAGILIKMKRNSVGQLLCGYYYPTTSFALLSMISYLIKPEKVSYKITDEIYSIVKDSSADLGVNSKIVQIRPRVKAVSTKISRNFLHICQYFDISERK